MRVVYLVARSYCCYHQSPVVLFFEGGVRALCRYCTTVLVLWSCENAWDRSPLYHFRHMNHVGYELRLHIVVSTVLVFLETTVFFVLPCPVGLVAKIQLCWRLVLPVFFILCSSLNFSLVSVYVFRCLDIILLQITIFWQVDLLCADSRKGRLLFVTFVKYITV